MASLEGLWIKEDKGSLDEDEKQNYYISLFLVLNSTKAISFYYFITSNSFVLSIKSKF